MSPKLVQILIIVAAVLTAAGIAALLGKSPDGTVPDDFEPPGWITVLEVFAPSVSRQQITRNGKAFPQELRLGPGQSVEYRVAADSDSPARKLAFEVLGGIPVIRYEAPDQEVQEWPLDESDRGEDPNFILYEEGGRLMIRNIVGIRPVDLRLRIKD